MVQKEEIENAFSEINVELKEEVIEKCMQICMTHNISPSDLVEEWMAHTISNSTEVVPTVELLSQMERKMAKLTSSSTSNSGRRSTATSVTVYTAKGSEVPEGNVLSLYSSNKSSVDNGTAASKTSHNNTNAALLFSPASFSPNAIKRSKKYSERTNSGKLVTSFGTDAVSDEEWTAATSYVVSVNEVEEAELMKESERYLFDTLRDKLQILFERTEFIGQEIILKYGLESSFDPLTLTMEESVFAGRVVCDSEGKLNASSLVLEYGSYSRGGVAMQLDVSKLQDYSLFPGQVVALKGKNPTGRVIFAEEIYTDVILPESPVPKDLFHLTESLQIVVAAGPFTPSDTLSYQPIEDLVQYTLRHNPHILILIGPIVDIGHPRVSDGTMAESFTGCYDRVLKGILQALSGRHTKVLVVSSWQEAGHHVVYPTPPSHTALKKQYPNLTVLPDPSIVSVGGVVIGVTSIDVLMHLGKEEISQSSGTLPCMDRLSRLASHLLQQRTFYPLLPPVVNDLPFDFGLWSKYAQIPLIPHILILPSDLRYFIKRVNNCIVLNPERLTKGQVGGNLARIRITPSKVEDEWSLSSHIQAQILKI